MKKILAILLVGIMLLSISGCNKTISEQIIKDKLNVIAAGGPQFSTNPFDYIEASREEYDELLEYPKETFEYAIKDIIQNQNYGLIGYIEATLCYEINTNFQVNFESANDFITRYEVFLRDSDSELNDYDKYALSLLNEERTTAYRQISMDEAKRLMETEDDYILLDVRTVQEYEERHIPGAINIPNELIGGEELDELPDKEQVILVYCRSGNRSKQASAKLVKMGYRNIVEIGGINDWSGEVE